MRLLLDTHILLWWLSDDPKLGETVRAAIADGTNDVFVSAVSIAEASIKQSLGKLEAPDDLASILGREGFIDLPLTVEHSVALRELPWHHRDPFDRMLIAQAQVEMLTLATADGALAHYSVPILAG